MMDDEQTARFESACTAAGARFIGGVMACGALAEHELTGAHTYYGLTPSDTRRTPTDAMTQGWFTGTDPDHRAHRRRRVRRRRPRRAGVLRLGQDAGGGAVRARHGAGARRCPSRGPTSPSSNFLDAGAAPLSVLLTADSTDLNIGIYSDGRYSYQLSIYVMRVEDETAVAVMFPDNPEARESVRSGIWRR